MKLYNLRLVRFDLDDIGGGTVLFLETRWKGWGQLTNSKNELTNTYNEGLYLTIGPVRFGLYGGLMKKSWSSFFSETVNIQIAGVNLQILKNKAL
jgi:hypothetical protein